MAFWENILIVICLFCSTLVKGNEKLKLSQRADLIFNVVPQYASVAETVDFTCIGEPIGDFEIQALDIDSLQFVTCSFQDCNFAFDIEQCSSLKESAASCRRWHSSNSIFFQIQSIENRDITDYRCIQKGRIGSTSIREYEQCVFEWQGSFVHNEGDSFTLHCIAHDGIPQVKNMLLALTYELQRNCGGNECWLTVEQATRQLHSKEAVCYAYQASGRAPAQISQILNITWPPRAATANDTVIRGRIGSSISLECHVSEADKGNPHYYHYFWTRHDGRYNQSTESGTLQILLQTEDLEDVYHCCPYNYVGMGQCAEISLNIQEENSVSAGGVVAIVMTILFAILLIVFSIFLVRAGYIRVPFKQDERRKKNCIQESSNSNESPYELENTAYDRRNKDNGEHRPSVNLDPHRFPSQVLATSYIEIVGAANTLANITSAEDTEVASKYENLISQEVASSESRAKYDSLNSPSNATATEQSTEYEELDDIMYHLESKEN